MAAPSTHRSVNSLRQQQATQLSPLFAFETLNLARAINVIQLHCYYYDHLHATKTTTIIAAVVLATDEGRPLIYAARKQRRRCE